MTIEIDPEEVEYRDGGIHYRGQEFRQDRDYLVCWLPYCIEIPWDLGSGCDADRKALSDIVGALQRKANAEFVEKKVDAMSHHQRLDFFRKTRANQPQGTHIPSESEGIRPDDEMCQK
ncbi:hypothetical protein [Roseovarius indicus]|uniref:hypothetical protein n=1 Tax=Roseovarius indicus TaxID=540747 RepID=UPI004058BD20